jgi:hypothetical protein
LSIAFYKEIPGLYKLWTTFSIFKTVFQLTLDPVANNSSWRLFSKRIFRRKCLSYQRDLVASFLACVSYVR